MINRFFTVTGRLSAALLLLAALLMAGCENRSTNGSINGTGKSPSPGTSPSSTPDQCSLKSDEEIVTLIYGKIARDKDLAPQAQQINVLSSSHAVTIWGWTQTEAQKTQVVDIAKDTCAVSVDSDHFYGNSANPLRPQPNGACAPGYTRCGELCLPSGTGCSLYRIPNPTPTVTNGSMNSDQKSGR